MTQDDLQNALRAAGVPWNEGHWVYRSPECACRFCVAVRVASNAWHIGYTTGKAEPK